MNSIKFLLKAVLIFSACINGINVYDVLSTGENTLAAVFGAIVVALLWGTISIVLVDFITKVSEQPSSSHRTLILGLLFGFVSIFGTVDMGFNMGAIARSDLEKNHIENIIDAQRKVVGSIEDLYGYIDSQTTNVKSVIDTAKEWKSCEETTGCVSLDGGGVGRTSIQLKGILATSKQANQKLLALDNDIAPIRNNIKRIYRKIDNVHKTADLDFDQKLEKSAELSDTLGKEIEKLQNLLPSYVFEVLAGALSSTIGQYRAQDLPDHAATRIFNQFSPYGQSFQSMAESLDHGKILYVPRIGNPSRLEILMSSTDALEWWAVSFILAFSSWLILLIFAINNSFKHHAKDLPPSSIPSGQISAQATPEPESVATLFPNPTTTTTH